MHDWTISTPETQGLDSALLADMLAHIDQQLFNLHSLLIIRRGCLVFEVYWHPYMPDTLNDLRSVAKSVTSILFGLALGQGCIQSVQQKVLDFFPGRTIAHLDARKQAITLEHLLTMTSGFDLTDADTFQMIQSPDWLQFVLNAPMIAEPGTRFQYASCSTYLLSVILQSVTGMNALDFARQYLFDPLEIKHFRWVSDAEGRTAGGFGLYLTARDLAKIGCLYLRNGMWKDQQIVPADWIRVSTRAHIGDYGYKWWVDSAANQYRAAGYGGQMAYVVSDQDMVVVMTAGEPNLDAVCHPLLNEWILPAVKSAAELPRNPVAASRLDARIQALTHPNPLPAPPVPPLAYQANGVCYELDHNSFGWKSFTLTYNNEDSAEIKMTIHPDAVQLPIGLDGLVRSRHVQKLDRLANDEPVALKGGWLDDRTLVLHLLVVGSPENWEITLVFNQNDVQVSVKDKLNGQTEQFCGRALD